MKKLLLKIFGSTDLKPKNNYKGRHLADDIQEIEKDFVIYDLGLDFKNPIIDDKRTNPNYQIRLGGIKIGELEYNSNTKHWEIVCFNDNSWRTLDAILPPGKYVIWNW